jgi:site-specific recombinase XerD
MKHLPIHNEEFEKLLKDFHKDCKMKGYSQVEMYASMVREFCFFMETLQVENIKEIKSPQIVAYYEYLRERPNQRREGGLSESMIRHHLFAVRLFFDYLLDAGEIESSPARLPKFTIGKSKSRNIPDLEEIKLIYKACETKRDHALVSIAYGCGLRRTEIRKLNLSDVQFSKGVLIVREGKGGKYRTVPLSDTVLRKLKEYVLYERSKYFVKPSQHSSTAFFISNRGLRIDGDKLNKRLKEIIEKTNNHKLIQKEITLHCLRHAFATHLLDNGANMEFVQGLLGHAGIDTVHIYSKRRKQLLNVKHQFDRHYAN